MMATGNKPPATVPAKAVYVMFERKRFLIIISLKYTTTNIVCITLLSHKIVVKMYYTRMFLNSRSNTGTAVETSKETLLFLTTKSYLLPEISFPKLQNPY
mgnify:CR=1 FL=1